MNDLQIFKNEEFGEIRTATVNDEPMFCLADLCRALEIKNAGDLRKRLNEKGIDTIDTLTNGGIQSLLYVNESNLYKTIFQSRKKSAERFTDWVTSEVLPSIRKTGNYQVPMSTSEKIQLLAEGHGELQRELETVKTDLHDFKQTMPLLAIDCEKITGAVRKKATKFLGGRTSKAYADKNLRSRVYSDLHREVKHQFGVSTYKAICRNQVDKALEFILEYKFPFILETEVREINVEGK